jgi:uncharacterized Fe-S center protein
MRVEKSKVFFTDMRCPVGTSLLTKLERLMDRAGIGEIDFDQKFVAIKVHFGEPGNLAFLRPNFAKTVADRVKSLGGKPFLTDCNTLYAGRRKHALEHLDSAMENGFSPLSTGCQMLIADGLKGTDDIEVEVPNGEFCKTARLGRALMDADIVVSLNHFKGHELTGFGGALKNLGMGGGSRAGKMQMHHAGKPVVEPEACRACGLCFSCCAQGAIAFGGGGKAAIDHDKCAGCGRCIGVCNFDAIFNPSGSENYELNCKIAEYALGAVHGRPNFHISVVNQVSPYCDCHGESDAPVVPDIGLFASFDPVALDRACIDAVNAAPGIESSILGHCGRERDHFTSIHPATDWRSQIAHAEKIGLGSAAYELVTL